MIPIKEDHILKPQTAPSMVCLRSRNHRVLCKHFKAPTIKNQVGKKELLRTRESRLSRTYAASFTLTKLILKKKQTFSAPGSTRRIHQWRLSQAAQVDPMDLKLTLSLTCSPMTMQPHCLSVRESGPRTLNLRASLGTIGASGLTLLSLRITLSPANEQFCNT
jgi:hypothetical protein